MGLANCATTDPDLFFPEKGGTTQLAKKVCRACEVQTQCLEYATSFNSVLDGVWAGTTVRERAKIQHGSET